MGSFPSAVVVVKIMTGKDILKLGSGNPGATNVFRTVGKGIGTVVLLMDVSKAILAVLLISFMLPVSIIDITTYKFIIGFAAILGHIFSPFLKFKGGKGVAVSAGVALAVYPLNFILAFSFWLAILLTTKIMSIASILAGFVFAISSLFLFENTSHIVLSFLAAFVITWAHRSNIARLLQGKERPFNR